MADGMPPHAEAAFLQFCAEAPSPDKYLERVNQQLPFMAGYTVTPSDDGYAAAYADASHEATR